MQIEVDTNKNYYLTINSVDLFVDYTNKRLKVAEFQNISNKIINEIIIFAKKEGLQKIITNIKIQFVNNFRDCGFVIEGIINGFFKGEDAYCLSFFLDESRSISKNIEVEENILKLCASRSRKIVKIKKQNFVVRNAEEKDILQMIKLFSTIFESYPTDIFNFDYIKEVLEKKILFKICLLDDVVISVASADMDKINMNAEITDCVTYPEYRGRGILIRLITCLERDLRTSGFYTLYSLSRAINPGINMALSNIGYKYGGRLVNNCHICGNFEDMNIWVKNLLNERGENPNL
jgi:beta-lysine N6-acetyltransferase